MLCTRACVHVAGLGTYSVGGGLLRWPAITAGPQVLKVRKTSSMYSRKSSKSSKSVARLQHMWLVWLASSHISMIFPFNSLIFLSRRRNHTFLRFMLCACSCFHVVYACLCSCCRVRNSPCRRRPDLLAHDQRKPNFQLSSPSSPQSP